MPRLEPVDYDPFTPGLQGTQSGPALLPVDHDPFNETSFIDRYHGYVKALPPGMQKGMAAMGGIAWELGDMFVAEPVRAFQRGLARQGQVARGEISSGTAARRGAGDTLTVAATPMAGNAGARAVGAMPDNALGIFAGKMAKTADRKALAKAEQMSGNGFSREEIWRETGWFQGADGKWRFEIDDSGSRFRNVGPEHSTLGKELTHPEMYAAYPDMAGVSVTRVPGYGASFMSDPVFGPQMEIGMREPSRRSAALHESQHGAQDIEDFAQGGNPSMFAFRGPKGAEDSYHRLAGEVEARNVQTRRDMTAAERRATPPWLTQDVPDRNQIVRTVGESQKQLSTETPKGITVYHGSPHDFDRFDSSKIGTGEGAQAYGHGLYFAESEGVARSYRDALSQYQVDGKPFDELNPQHWAAAELEIAKGDKAVATAELTRRIESMNPAYEGAERARLMRARNLLQSGVNLPIAKDTGRLYQVSIKADPEQFLDWDKPLSAQSEAVRRAVKEAGFDEIYLVRDEVGGPALHRNEAGELKAFYTKDKAEADAFAKQNKGFSVRSFTFNNIRNIERDKGRPDADIAAALREAGIPGIRYLDQGSRNQKRILFDGKPAPADHPSSLAASALEQSASPDEAIRYLQARGSRFSKVTADDATIAEAIELLRSGRVADHLKPTYNYVVFPGNEHLIGIVKKYGIAGAATTFGLSQSEVIEAMGSRLEPVDYDPFE